MWRPVSDDQKLGSSMDYIELLSNLAGNCWSAFHYLPVQMCLISTIGRFHKGVNPAFIQDLDDGVPTDMHAEEAQVADEFGDCPDEFSDDEC